MKYEEYEHRIRQLGQFLRKYRKALIIGILTLLAILLVVFGIGFRLTRMRCDSVEYGNTPKPTVKTTAIGKEFWYREQGGSGGWTTEVPWKVGKYEVRAESVSFLGIRYEIGRDEFEITPKKLQLSMKNYEIVGDVSLDIVKTGDMQVSGLVYGDYISELTLDQAYDAEGYVTNALNLPYTVSECVILHENGSSANNCYLIESNTGNIKDIRVELFISPKSKNVKYDGNPNEEVRCDGYDITRGELKEGHIGVLVCDAVQKGFGTTKVTPTFSVIDAEGNDVSHMYHITVGEATLSFLKRKIKITSSSASKKYDGTPLTKDEYKLKGDGIAEGDTLEVHCYGSRTEVGSSKNVFSYTITNRQYGDVSYCYEVEMANGQLTVKTNADKFIGADKKSFDLSESGMDLLSGISAMKGEVLFNFRGSVGRLYYFKEAAYEQYNGRSWNNPEGSDPYLPESDYLTGHALRDDYQRENSIAIRNNRLLSDIYPYYMVSEYEPGADDGTGIFRTYVPTSEKTMSFPKSREEWISEYDDYVYAHYLDVPDDVMEVLLQLGAEAGLDIVAESGNLDSLIDGIANYISSAAIYSFNYTIPRDQDMVIWFLTQEKRGVCQHFATAATLMFRAYGVPARYAVGVCAKGKKNSWSTAYTTDGHAWVEIYLDGTGWIPVEVTPGAANGMAGLGIGGGKLVGFDTIDGDGFDFGDPNFEPEEFDLIITFGKNEREYDGEEVSPNMCPWYVLKNDLPVDCEIEVECYFDGEIGPEVGSYTGEADVHVYDGSGNDVTSQYKVYIGNPSVVIRRREIEITTFGREGTEDDSVLASDRWFISKGTLARGDRIEVTLSMRQDSKGVVWNEPSEVYIYSKYDEVVNENYYISYKYGDLEMK